MMRRPIPRNRVTIQLRPPATDEKHREPKERAGAPPGRAAPTAPRARLARQGANRPLRRGRVAGGRDRRGGFAALRTRRTRHCAHRKDASPLIYFVSNYDVARAKADRGSNRPRYLGSSDRWRMISRTFSMVLRAIVQYIGVSTELNTINALLYAATASSRRAVPLSRSPICAKA